MKKMLWVRKLFCGHSRPTNIAYMSCVYDKPEVGEDCYCRDCCEDVKITGVREANAKEIKELKQMIKMIK